MNKVRACVLLGLLALLAGCGGGKSNNSNGGRSSNPVTVGGPVSSPIVVTTSAGQAASGINISVPAPAASPLENAQVMGANPLGCPSGNCFAFSTGGTISRSNPTATVIAFGTGLSGNMQISFSGPADITISNIQSVQSTDNPPVPGVQFDVAVLPTAALGARTLVLQAPNNDITTFTGGLEIVP